MAGSLILNVTYGIDVQSPEDTYMRMAESTVAIGDEAATPGAFLVDVLPILKYVPEWFPGAGFKTKANEWQKITTATLTMPFLHVKDAMEKGVYTTSVASQALERCHGNEELEIVARQVSGIAYIGGADTTVFSLLTFILAMVLYPDVMRRAHEELDAVVGQDRIPEFSDKPFLPSLCNR